MRVRLLILLTATALIFPALVAPANASTFRSTAAGINCINKDLVAGVCLPKNRKKWAKSYENNYLLSCLGSAREQWAPDIKSAGLYCGCTIVEMEKIQTRFCNFS